MNTITIRAQLATDDDAESVEIRVTQGAVLIRSATVPASDATASFEMDDGDYVAHALVAGRDEVIVAFAVPARTAVVLQVP